MPERYRYTGNPRFGGGWSRCCGGRVRRIYDCCSYSDRRINGDASVTRLLLRGAQGVLHRVPRHEHPLLSEPVIAVLALASALAGLSTLYSP